MPNIYEQGIIINSKLLAIFQRVLILNLNQSIKRFYLEN